MVWARGSFHFPLRGEGMAEGLEMGVKRVCVQFCGGCQAGGEGATTAAMTMMQYAVVRQWGLLVAAVALLLDFASKELVLGLAASGALPLWWVPAAASSSTGT